MRKCSDVTGEIKTGIRVAKDFKLKNKTKPQNTSKVSVQQERFKDFNPRDVLFN